MEEEILSKDLWWRVTVPDPEALDGVSLVRFFNFVLNQVQVSHVTIIDAQWMHELLNVQPIKSGVGSILITDVQNLLSILHEIVQLDWGYFFFTASAEAAHKITLEDEMDETIPKAILTICGMDNSLYVLYTQDESLAHSITKEYANYEKVEAESNVLSAPEFAGYC